MAFLILLVGLVLLAINILSWRKIRHSLQPNLPRLTQHGYYRDYITAIVKEWREYSLGDGSNRGWRNLAIAFAFFFGLLLANGVWFKFEWLSFISASLAAIFIAQIRIGRSLHRKAFEASFPEALAVISASVSAGNSIHQALYRCGQDVAGDLGNTFNRIDRRLNLGEEADRVFIDAWLQYPYREFYFFIIVIQVSIQRGGQLRTLINRLARIINDSKKMAKRKKAMTSEARTSAKIVAAMPLLFFFGMKYLNPENYDFIIHDPIGRLILYYVIGSELIGMFIIWILLKRAT
ncbi:tight adherence protein B [Enterobacter asburiae]|uniref:type II secretion system F family protein n=1 Tax=Enterobacter asburiae TaxID=61645 RepID=UPI00141A9944|nr:type II secretion system F family protein [Enterobacter asburiae]NIH92217.1 tight adherence protein B [Enterobacter asburiae]